MLMGDMSSTCSPRLFHQYIYFAKYTLLLQLQVCISTSQRYCTKTKQGRLPEYGDRKFSKMEWGKKGREENIPKDEFPH